MPYELSKNLTLRILKDLEISRKFYDFIKLLLSAQSSSEKKILSVLLKISGKTEIHLFPWCTISNKNWSLSQIFRKRKYLETVSCFWLAPHLFKFDLFDKFSQSFHAKKKKKKINLNSRTFQDFFPLFPGLFPSKFRDFSRSFDKIPGLSRTFMELYK